MSASKEHWQAIAIVNAGERIRRLKQANASPEVVRENQREVWRHAIGFVADLLGPDTHFEILDYEHPMDHAAEYLNALRPLFPAPPEPAGIFWADFISEVRRLSFGDEPQMIKPEPRLPGQPVRPAQVAFLRLRALEWAAFWKSAYARPMHFQRAIELAFGADWDAIRHWPKSIAKVIGQKSLRSLLTDAPDGYFIDHRAWHKTLMDPLRMDGMMYRTAIGIAEMSDEVIHGEWENLTRVLSVHEALPRG